MTNGELMTACKKGVGNYKGSMDDANNLLAECYATIGSLDTKYTILKNELEYLYGQDLVQAVYKKDILKALNA